MESKNIDQLAATTVELQKRRAKILDCRIELLVLSSSCRFFIAAIEQEAQKEHFEEISSLELFDEDLDFEEATDAYLSVELVAANEQNKFNRVSIFALALAESRAKSIEIDAKIEKIKSGKDKCNDFRYAEFVEHLPTHSVRDYSMIELKRVINQITN